MDLFKPGVVMDDCKDLYENFNRVHLCLRDHITDRMLHLMNMRDGVVKTHYTCLLMSHMGHTICLFNQFIEELQSLDISNLCCVTMECTDNVHELFSNFYDSLTQLDNLVFDLTQWMKYTEYNNALLCKKC